MAAGAENLVAPLVAPTRDFSGVSQSTAVILSAFGQETDFADTLAATAVADNEKRPLSLTDNGRPISDWRDLNPRPLAPQADGDGLESGSRKRVTNRRSRRCYTGCDSSPENDHGDAVGDSPTIKADSFSAGLAMIASLPLSDAEKADAVRRLMAEQAAK